MGEETILSVFILLLSRAVLYYLHCQHSLQERRKEADFPRGQVGWGVGEGEDIAALGKEEEEEETLSFSPPALGVGFGDSVGKRPRGRL